MSTTSSTDPSSSPRRIAASRANGAESHGPTTSEGLAICAAAKGNLRHGLLSQTVVLASESRARFEALLDEYLNQYRPANYEERNLVEIMTSARWRQMRAVCFQKNDLDIEIAKQQSAAIARHIPPVAATLAFRALMDNSNGLSNAIRDETSFERQFNRTLRELERRINARLQNQGGAVAAEAEAPFTTAWDNASSNFDHYPAGEQPEPPEEKSDSAIRS